MTAPVGGTGGALEGLVVIDLTQMLAGPYSTMMLADQGARVIKVEPPGGENTRRAGPRTEGALGIEQGGFGPYFASVNRNKESIVLDLKTPQGKDALLRLIDRADALVENFRSGVMERLGLAYETLIRRNPKLVYATLRGFGDPRTGLSPYADWPVERRPRSGPESATLRPACSSRSASRRPVGVPSAPAAGSSSTSP